MAKFSIIQTHLSCHFHFAVGFPGLRRSGSWSQIIDQAQDFLEQASRHRDLGQLKRDVPPVAHDLRADLHQIFSERPHKIAEVVGQRMKLEPDGIVAERTA